MTWLYLVECEESFNKLEKRPVYAAPEFKEGFEYGWRAACRLLEKPLDGPKTPQPDFNGGTCPTCGVRS